MGAVTTERAPVPGCRVHPLGVMRYLPIASQPFVERYLPDGFTAAGAAGAPSRPRERGRIAGVMVSEIYSVGPLAVGSAMNITVWSYVDQLNISVLADDQTLEDTHEATRIRSNPQGGRVSLRWPNDAECLPRQIAESCLQCMSAIEVPRVRGLPVREVQHFHLADGQEVVLIDRAQDGVVTVAEAASNDVDVGGM